MSTPGIHMAARRRKWLLDLDGTLVDSGPAHEAAFREAMAQLAPELLPHFCYAEHAGAPTIEVFVRLGAVAAQALAARKQELYLSIVARGGVRLLPGARALLEALHRRGYDPYLVTGGRRRSVEAVLAAGGLRGCFRGVLTADDTTWGKPDPRVYREALRRFRLDPADVVVVEDSAHGVAAAVGAGLLTLRVHGRGELPAAAVDIETLAAIVAILDREEPR